MNPTYKPLRLAFALVFAFSFFARLLPAQDIIVSDPVPVSTFGNRPKPDKPAAFIKKIQITNLQPLENITTCAYAIIHQAITPSGKILDRSCQIRTTHNEEMLKVMPEEFRTQTFTPATLNGQPALWRSWYSVIYNPPDSTPGKANASPRLLRIFPVTVPTNILYPIKGKKTILWVDAHIDESGKMTEYTLPPDSTWGKSLRDHIKQWLDKWEFAPARKDGKNVAGTLRMPVYLYPTTPAADSQRTAQAGATTASSISRTPQDITITSPQLPTRKTSFSADTPPSFIHEPAPQNINVMSDVSSYGYAIISLYLDENGTISERLFRVLTTHASLVRALPANYRSASLVPGLRDGVATAGRAWYSLIYNPPDAASGLQNAKPRLHAIYPVEIYGSDA